MESAADGSRTPGAADGDKATRPAGDSDDANRPADLSADARAEAGRPSGEAGQVAGETAGRVTGRSGRNLPAAIAVGLVLAALVIGSLYTIKALFLLVAGVAVGLGVTELVRAFATRGIQVPLAPVLTGLAAMIAGAYWGGPAYLVGAFAVTIFTLLAWRMIRKNDGTEHASDGYVRDASASVLIAAYPAFLAGFVGLLLEPPDGAHRVVVFVAVTVASDIGGYAAGVLFGRHKMAPEISPKKTWEGFAGSALACVLVGAWLVSWLLSGAIWQGALLGAVVVVFATAGDLVESVIKRDLQLKDLGRLLPGHGGMMDRLDSLVVTLIPVWVLLELFIQR
ncbi:phosphatidate cytidylyltransferase [Spongiactinospora gelatinilytica]|uniref:phosphatidate cytidylyltransferase n=1 Tax=Spongiactinospora gelatinilytica TaxID=2666298 RepID=UPI001F455D40|nr:phosphatidate cytidylyltransferase [Spongiactinospora gelatinilytica]